MKALSIRQPWCHHILHDGKDVENRNWRTNFRGRVLIHASKNDSECRGASAFKDIPLGGIVGVMTIVDCVDKMDSDWFCGDYGFVIADARPLAFIRCKGALGFFDVPPEVEAAVLRQLA